MKHLTKTLLWSVAASYLLLRTYQGFRHPSSVLSWFIPCSFMMLAGLALFDAFGSYHHKKPDRPTAAPDPLNQIEQIAFKTLGLPVVFVGLVLFGLAARLAWGQWVRVARWPRTDAILMSKDISSVGARLVFQYEANGQRFTGLGFRFGSEKTVRNTLEAYEPGTVQKISYDPEDPTQVETNLSYSWELFLGPVSAAVFGVFSVVGGVAVYRWSYGRFSPPLVNRTDSD
jgi:hypothetical protein